MPLFRMIWSAADSSIDSFRIVSFYKTFLDAIPVFEIHLIQPCLWSHSFRNLSSRSRIYLLYLFFFKNTIPPLKIRPAPETLPRHQKPSQVLFEPILLGFFGPILWGSLGFFGAPTQVGALNWVENPNE